MWIDTSDKAVRTNYHNRKLARDVRLNAIFSRCGVDKVELFTGQNYIEPLMKLFKKKRETITVMRFRFL